MGSRVATNEVADRVGHGLDERGRNADRQGDAERVTKARGILDDCPLLGAGDGYAQHAVDLRESPHRRLDRRKRTHGRFSVVGNDHNCILGDAGSLGEAWQRACNDLVQ